MPSACLRTLRAGITARYTGRERPYGKADCPIDTRGKGICRPPSTFCSGVMKIPGCTGSNQTKPGIFMRARPSPFLYCRRPENSEGMLSVQILTGGNNFSSPCRPTTGSVLQLMTLFLFRWLDAPLPPVLNLMILRWAMPGT